MADDVFTPYISYSTSYESNLLRLKDSQQALSQVGTTSMSDTVHQSAGGLKFNDTFGRQVITADASLMKTDFARFTQYDFSGKSYIANWSWVVGDNLSGNIGSTYKQSLLPFQDLNTLERIVRAERDNYLQAEWKLHPSWRLTANINKYDLGYDLSDQRAFNFTLQTVGVGINYVAHTGSSVGVEYAHNRGFYPNAYLLGTQATDNNYAENSLKARIQWLMSGKTTLEFLGGWAERLRDSDTSRDFSGFNARLTAKWAATDKTLITISARRELGALDDLSANYALTTAVNATASWLATSKIKVDAMADYENQSYNGSGNLRGITPSDRRDRYQRLSLGVTYKPTKPVSIIGSIFNESVNSNIDSNDYRANGAALNLRYDF